MIAASPTPAQPCWQTLWREAVTDARELLTMLGLEQMIGQLPVADAGFPTRIPHGFIRRMRHGDPKDPLLLQVLPQPIELDSDRGLDDAVGDLAARVGHGLIQKYHGRALLIASGACAIHCRYCFRRHFPYAEETAAANRWQQALQWTRRHPDVDEIILSGGDPLALSTAKLSELTRELAQIPHIRRLRIHTRLPVVLPQRIDTELLDWLHALPWPTVMVLHCNHANEIDNSVAAVCATLRSVGVHLLNQSVLMKGINDEVEILSALSVRLFDIGVLPYYLHQLDPVRAAMHFLVADERATALHAGMRARLPGYLLPRLVREIPGAEAKLPVLGVKK